MFYLRDFLFIHIVWALLPTLTITVMVVRTTNKALFTWPHYFYSNFNRSGWHWWRNITSFPFPGKGWEVAQIWFHFHSIRTTYNSTYQLTPFLSRTEGPKNVLIKLSRTNFISFLISLYLSHTQTNSVCDWLKFLAQEEIWQCDHLLGRDSRGG